MIVSELVAMLGFDVDQASFKSAKSTLSKFISGLNSATSAGAIAEETLEGYAKLVIAAREVAESVAQVGNQIRISAAQLGMGTTEFQKLQFSAQLAGVSVQDISNAMRTLSTRALAAANGSLEAQRAFALLRVSIAKGGKLRAPEDLLAQVANGLAHASSETERFALATRMFGRGGLRILAYLQQGTEEIRRQQKEFAELGGILSPHLEKLSQKFVQNQAFLAAWIQGLKNALAEEMLPYLIQAQEIFLRLAKEYGPEIRDIIRDIGGMFGRTVRGVAQLVDGVSSMFKTWQKWWNSMPKVSQGILKLTALFEVILGLIYAWPLGIAAAVALIILLIDDISAFLNGDDVETRTGHIVEAWKKIAPVIKKAFEDAIGFVADILELKLGPWLKILQWMMSIKNPLGAGTVGNSVGKAINELVNFLIGTPAEPSPQPAIGPSGRGSFYTVSNDFKIIVDARGNPVPEDVAKAIRQELEKTVAEHSQKNNRSAINAVAPPATKPAASTP